MASDESDGSDSSPSSQDGAEIRRLDDYSTVDTTTESSDDPGQSPTEYSSTASSESSPQPPSESGTPDRELKEKSGSIEDLILEFDEQESIIRDHALLDPNTVIDEDRIVGRDSQLREVTEMLRVAVGGNRPPNLFLYGPSGTGKSLIINAVCENLKKICANRGIEFGTLQMNCQDIDTLGVGVYELARLAANEADDDVEVPKHGVATKEKWRELYRIVNENFDSVVFVLDELDMLIGRRDKEQPAFSRMLYQLSRAGTTNELEANISVVAISNDTKLLERVGSRALSSFNPEDVFFNDYDANQLQAILRNRKDAFAEGSLSSDVIPLSAAFAAKTHGDARKAIDLFRIAGNFAERDSASEVREEHVRAAQDKLEKNRVLEVTRGITTQKKLALYATAAVAGHGDRGTARSTTGYKVYQFLTDTLGADQYQQESYVNKMKELTTYSLVSASRKSKGPDSGMYMEFAFGENPETIISTVREDSRLSQVSEEELESVVKAQVNKES